MGGGTMNLSEMRVRVRRDLRDEDATAERWSDAALDRHIARAVAELSLASPREATAVLTATAGSRDLDIASLTGRVAVESVEFPVGQYPPAHVEFTVWGETLTLEMPGLPGAQSVTVRYTAAHTLDAVGTTLPVALQDIAAGGAAAYAALEWSSYATNRVNVGGAETWRDYHTWSLERLAAFHAALAKHGRARRVRSRYVTAATE